MLTKSLRMCLLVYSRKNDRINYSISALLYNKSISGIMRTKSYSEADEEIVASLVDNLILGALRTCASDLGHNELITTVFLWSAGCGDKGR